MILNIKSDKSTDKGHLFFEKEIENFLVASVIEYLNYDPRSGHDTFDQKVLLRVISARVKDPQVDFLVFMCVMSRPMVIIKVLYDTRIDQ